MNLLRILPLFGLSLVFAACGGGGGGIDLGAAFDDSRALTHPGDDDDLFGSISDGGSVRRARRLYVGDTRHNAWRATAGFNLHAPAAGTTLARATLVITIDEIYGDPTRLGLFLVRYAELGETLEAADYSGLWYRGRTINPATLVRGRMEIDVTTLVAEAYDRGSQDMDFRFRFGLGRTGLDESDGMNFYVNDLQLVWE